MSENKGNGPSLTEIAGQFSLTAADVALTVTGKFVDTATVVAGSVIAAVDVDELSKEVADAKDQLRNAASVAVFSLVGKAASHPLASKAIGALFAPKQGGGKHSADEQPAQPTSSLLDTALNTAVDSLGRFITTKLAK